MAGAVFVPHGADIQKIARVQENRARIHAGASVSKFEQSKTLRSPACYYLICFGRQDDYSLLEILRLISSKSACAVFVGPLWYEFKVRSFCVFSRREICNMLIDGTRRLYSCKGSRDTEVQKSAALCLTCSVCHPLEAAAN